MVMSIMIDIVEGMPPFTSGTFCPSTCEIFGTYRKSVLPFGSTLERVVDSSYWIFFLLLILLDC
jgi:hypothetical protein